MRLNHPIFSELLWELYDGTAKEITEDEKGVLPVFIARRGHACPGMRNRAGGLRHVQKPQ